MKDILAVVIVLAIVLGLVYFVWVGLFWLTNVVFGTTLNIWWGGLFGMVASSILSNIFKSSK